jgi:Outer membrane protein beta-barrel domain
MRRSLLGVAVFALGLSIVATGARAQETTTTTTTTRPVQFGVSAGLTVPTGDFGDLVNTGFNLNGLVEGKLTTAPISLRGEFTFGHFGFDESFAGIGGSSRILAGVANALYYFPIRSSGGGSTMIKPYAIGGLGLYNVHVSVDNDGSDSETKFGLNLGGGVEVQLTGLSAFGEIRYHTIFTSESNTNMFPLSFGIKF